MEYGLQEYGIVGIALWLLIKEISGIAKYAIGRRNGKNGNPGHNPGNPGHDITMVIGGMNEKLSGIQGAVEDLDKSGWERHQRMRQTMVDVGKSLDKLTGAIEPMDERIKKLKPPQ